MGGEHRLDELESSVKGSYRLYNKETGGQGYLTRGNLRSIIKLGINEGLSAQTPTFCQAAEYVQHFMATRHRLLWLMMMEISFNHAGKDDEEQMVKDLNTTITRFSENMKSYDEEVRSFESDDLLRAIASSPTQCKKQGFGTYCNSGQTRVENGIMVGCHCDGMWQGKITVPKSETIDLANQPSTFSQQDGATQHQCYMNPYSCGNKGEYIISVAEKALAVGTCLVCKDWLHAKGGSNGGWWIFAAGSGKVCIQSRGTGKFLKDHRGELDFFGECHAWEKWSIEWAGNDWDSGALIHQSRTYQSGVTAVR